MMPYGSSWNVVVSARRLRMVSRHVNASPGASSRSMSIRGVTITVPSSSTLSGSVSRWICTSAA
jgi:hypothetical protein